MWERNISWLPPLRTPTRDRTCYLGMCPDWGSNLQTFGVWDDAPINWATWPGLGPFFFLSQRGKHSLSSVSLSDFIWAGILFCIFSIVASTFGAALVNGIVRSGWDIVSSGSCMSSSAPGLRQKQSHHYQQDTPLKCLEWSYCQGMSHWLCVCVCVCVRERERERERDRERERERERRGRGRERETLISCLPHGPQLGTEPAAQVCAWLGIKPATFWCTGWSSNQLSHLARAGCMSLSDSSFILC